MVDINPINEDVNEFQENERPPSEQLVELHLYLVPKDKWLEKRKLAKIQAVDHTISVGFVRVLPQTLLSELRKEMDRQLGIESVPEHYVFLRSVGRNFTQVRPKQEMEMKVKNYLPPFAPEPELYLKEGTYTGPNTWSQGEDSGLEESLDSNSQRSHDRATPESLTDDPISLPKLLPDFDLPDFDECRMPPSGGMTVSMSADDLSAVGQTSRKKSDVRQSVVQATGGRFASSEDVRYRKIRERSLEKSVGRQAEAARGGSWNRRQKRGESKERGGTQLPTWAETRTTRLRRSKALGETTNATQNKKPQKKPTKSSQSSKLPPAVPRPPPSYHDDSEKDEEREDDADEIEEFDDGHVLMERIRANSRCLKAQVSARERRTVANTGTRGPVVPPGRNKDGKGANGVYTMHARRNLTLRGGGTNEVPPEIESTVIRLVDAEGREVDGTSNEEGREDGSVDEPEVVHHHTLAVDGRDGREFGNQEGLPNISENGLESKTISEADSEDNNNYGSPSLKTAATPETEETSETDSSNNFLEEGRLVNQNGKLTIEIEVKELENTSEDGSSTSATIDQQNLTPVVVDESNEYDSYRVYSEQNILTPSDAPTATLPQDQATSLSRRSSRVDDPVRLSRAKQARGVYLRRMEHQNNSNSRTQAIEGGGGSPARRFGNARSVSQNRKSGRAKLEKWSTTAASTGDLRDAAWDYSNDSK
ncbi:hypothetical protein JTE90_027779 [Oedothorax gibbosus]|uniref:Spermatogenesis-associated protein 1 n=1 Tax=Oedothorax gibbosus TaxID=931172 RepID=A0AAV6V8D6_9ARAC|nr:hypothetical protein JTE90_027779 [Oedothorax gibbosus]